VKPEERRRHPRKPLQDRAVLHRKAEPAHATLYCTTVDISPSGLQLKLKQALAAGEPVELVVHVPGHQGSFRLRGETRWCTAARIDKSYLLGVELTDIEDPEYADWRNLFI
jgi:PilZ domain